VTCVCIYHSVTPCNPVPAQVEHCRAVAQELTLDVGDTAVLDLMMSHSGSPFREGVRHACGSARYVLFSMWGARPPAPRPVSHRNQTESWTHRERHRNRDQIHYRVQSTDNYDQ
jgi:hypothetical protein